MKAFLRSLVPALVGGGVVAVVLLATNVGDRNTTTTVLQQTPLTKPVAASNGGLTAGDIYKRDAPGVVFVRSTITNPSQSPFDLLPQQPQGPTEASGSGFSIDHNGNILTNAHVIDGASKVTVTFEDKQTKTATVVGKDVSTDIALLKVDPSGLKLNPLELGDSSTVQVGDPTIAIGNPFGLDRTLTEGVISALQRRIDAPNGFSIDHVIQTDAAINPGNSGGPLLDAAGRVIGINSQIATAGGGGSGGQGQGGNVGIGFAVPINTAKQVIPQLEHGGKVAHAYLGVVGATIDASLSQLGLAAKSGVLVQSVTPGSPAARAGIHGGTSQASVNGSPISLGGDVITKIDGKTVSSADQLVSAVAAKKPGDKVQLTLLAPNGKTRDVSATLTTRPAQAPRQP